jgi:hypothetical protein
LNTGVLLIQEKAGLVRYPGYLIMRIPFIYPPFLRTVSFRTILMVMIGLPGLVHAQGTTVTGKVTDKRSGEPLAFVTVTFNAKLRGTLTDEKGSFILHATEPVRRLIVSMIGYKTATLDIMPAKQQAMDVALEPDAIGLAEVIVNPGKRAKYSNKNNPAVELIRQVIAHKEENRMESYSFTEFRQYERMIVSLAHLSDTFRKKKIFKDYQFLFKAQDSDALGGKLILPLYMEEKSSFNYFRKSPKAQKQIVQAFRQVKYNEDFIDNKGLSTYLNFLYEDIDIYDNNILLLTNQLLSPVAGSGPTFYEYYIRDTVKDVTPQLVKLAFRPRNTTDLLFEGVLYITMDGHFAVKDALLRTNRHINLNFVRGMEGRLSFEKGEDGRFRLFRSDIKIDFGLTKGKTGGMFGERLVSRDSLRAGFPRPDAVFAGPAVVMSPGAEAQDTGFWSARHPDSSGVAANQVYRHLDSMQTIPSYKRNVAIASLLLSGYKSFGKFEMGPVNSFYSFNPVEGTRPRLGGRTTTALSRRYYFEGYGAYGMLDKQFKYFGSVTYSLNNKSVYTFPQKYIRASYQHDTKIPGLDLAFIQENNFLLSFKRGANDQWTYNDIFRLDYMNELENHFSYSVGYKYWRQLPAGALRFNTYANGDAIPMPSITSSELSLALRYAPHEKFYQGKLYRTPLIDRNPVFNLRYTQGIQGFLGGEYSYKNLTVNISKRFYLSQFGFTNTSVEGGYIFGQAPFPLLSIHRANQTYSLQPQAYNLMNFLEFVSDHYAAVNLEHNFNGFLFNKVPLMKKLRWREIIGAKLLWGGLRNENNPVVNPSLVQLPLNAQGLPTTFTLHSGPYIEGSIGIGNIFKLVRIDLVKRFTYLQNPQVSPLGVRMLIKFDF